MSEDPTPYATETVTAYEFDEGEKTMQTAETEIDQERLAEIEAELEAAAAEVGATTIEYEKAKYARDQALKRHVRAMGLRERLLAGKDV